MAKKKLGPINLQELANAPNLGGLEQTLTALLVRDPELRAPLHARSGTWTDFETSLVSLIDDHFKDLSKDERMHVAQAAVDAIDNLRRLSRGRSSV